MVKTPSETWKEHIVQLRKSCQSILKTSSKIRYVGVINQHGRTLTGVMRPDTKPLLKPEHIKNEFFLISNVLDMRSQLVKSLGALDHVILHHAKVNIILIQKDKYVYYTTVDTNASTKTSSQKNLSEIISKIKKAI